MRYTPAEREDLARRKEQWILRIEQGEDPKRVRRELHLTLSLKTLPRLNQRYRQGGRKWQALLERRHGIATKGTPEVKAFVAKAKAKNPQVTAGALVGQIWERFEIEISLNRMNELLRAAGLNNPVGRPKLNPADPPPKAPERDVDYAGAFFPLGALDELGVPEVVHAVVEKGRAKTPTRVLGAAWELTWDKIVHLIFLPVLDATRPWQLRYTLGTGLLGVCQTAYRFETIQRTLGELSHAQLGTPLRYGLGRAWVKTLVGSETPLHLYIDAHLKPHWTHIFMPCGHVAMLNRVMPCTRQIMVTTPEGYVLEILDRVGDAHLSQDLPGIEQELERVTRHAVTLTIVDREANGVALAQNYAQSDHFALLTLLDDSVAAGLVLGTPEAAQIFRLTGRWQSLTAEPGASLAPAVWGPARTDPEDPRVFSPKAGARGRDRPAAGRLHAKRESTRGRLRPGRRGCAPWEWNTPGLHLPHRRCGSGALAGDGRGDPRDGRWGEPE